MKIINISLRLCKLPDPGGKGVADERARESQGLSRDRNASTAGRDGFRCALAPFWVGLRSCPPCLLVLLVATALLSGCGRSIESLTIEAKRGNAGSAYRLAEIYRLGKDVERNLSKARVWYSQAAEDGHACAPAGLGSVYEEGGSGVAQDYAKALKWYKSGAERGDPNSYLKLGLIHLKPAFAKPSYEKAAKWLTKALDSPEGAECLFTRWGKSEVMFYLALMYYEGKGVERNKEHALSLLRDVRKHRRFRTHENLVIGKATWKKTTVTTPALPADWIRSASADRGFALAQAMLGHMYAEGKNGVEKNNYEAYIWYSLAISSGHREFVRNILDLEEMLSYEDRTRAKTEANARRRVYEMAK